jgi:hypothetical protein
MNFHVEKRIPINYEFPRRKSSIILRLALVMSKSIDDLYSSFPHHYYFFRFYDYPYQTDRVKLRYYCSGTLSLSLSLSLIVHI